MMDLGSKQYLLVIKRGNNDYLPLEWHLTNFYNNENLYTLEGIDNFTKKITRLDLINEILNQNMVSSDERFRDFAIIYLENGKYHELKEGTIFKEDNDIINEDGLITFIYNYYDKKNIVNKIYNLCKGKTNEEKIEQFKYVLKNIDLFSVKGDKAIKAALSIFKDISYENKRSILIKVSRRIIIKSDELN